MRHVMLALMCVAAAAGRSSAQEAEGPADREAVAWHLTSPVVKQIDPIERYLYAQTEATFAEMGEALRRTFFVVAAETREAGLYPANPPVFIYRGATPDPQTPFTLLAGYPMSEGARVTAGTQLAALDRFRCASVFYTGPIADLSRAYDSLMPKLIELGLKPTDEIREVYLWWVGEESHNNVIEIQVGLAE
jgi:effector-binding domain-containing protein